MRMPRPSSTSLRLAWLRPKTAATGESGVIATIGYSTLTRTG